MNSFKKIIVLLSLSLLLCITGCAEKYSEYDNFNPSSVYVVDCISGTKYESLIENSKSAKIMLDAFKELKINTEEEGEMGSSYLYLRFYAEDESTMLIFTIYENGSCCLGEDFEEFYTVENGMQAYNDLCSLYGDYASE